MGFDARVLADSIGPSGTRLCTLLVDYPRFIHAEMMTHRVFSRDSASSRAIPTERLIEQVENDPALPIHWGKNQSGMQAWEELDATEAKWAERQWEDAATHAADLARDLAALGVHKQVVNRILEPYLWHTVIISATEWTGFYAQRLHPDAQPEIRRLAELMKAAMDASFPAFLEAGQWHLPLVNSSDSDEAWNFCGQDESAHADLLCRLSAARCARVSYGRHLESRPIEKDLELYERLVKDGRFSPLEHVAQAVELPAYMQVSVGKRITVGQRKWSGNFREWRQLRETVDPGFIGR